ncbi:general stress protein [Jeotgalibacillus proteolyticus]|uniref:General stress protein n=1 Tax=Jeotgalibacillus proteolyticus TaxID=2082395 RepID=A0A2S5G9Y5_9BACL|nr:general stress protein [Jeotgalibacillus proteolyticus]PPA69734.1 general stress protein [Jeotgalibacillus proteolyticus]
MSLYYKEFSNDEEVVNAVNSIKTRGVNEDTIYVVTHDDDRTKRVADNADANTIGASDIGLATATKNVFRKKGDELRAQFEEIGFTTAESENLEDKLDQGKILVIVKDAPAGFTI